MRNTIIIIASLALVACGKSENASRAEFIAAGLNAISPKSLGGGMMMNKATANGSKLTLSIGGASSSDLAMPDFNSQLQSAVCQDPGFRKVIDQGLDVTMDVTSAAGHSAKVEVTSC